MSEAVVSTARSFIGVAHDTCVRAERTGLELSLEEITTVVILLFYGTSSYIPVLMPNTGGAVTVDSQLDQVHSVNHVVLALVWTTGAFLIARSWKYLRLRSWPALFALSLSFWGMASTLWSISPSSSFSAGLSAVFSTLFAIYIFGRFSRRRTTVILTWVFMGLAIGSAAFALFLPVYGIDHFTHEGAWQGVFNQKNTLGNAMVYAMVVAIAFRAKGSIERIWRAALFLISAMEVFLSQSREAWLAAAVAIMIYSSTKLLTRFAVSDRRFLLPLGAGCTLTLSSLALIYGPLLFRSLGRDATLTGRTDLWLATIEQIPGHWVVGYGLNAFWMSPAATNVYLQIRWEASSAHNGYLETLLELGIVGLSLLLLLLLFTWRDAWRTTRNRNLDPSILAYVLISILTLLNIVTGATFSPNSIHWMLLILAASMLEEDAEKNRRIKHAVGLALAM